jgi:hypothetical protein
VRLRHQVEAARRPRLPVVKPVAGACFEVSLQQQPVTAPLQPLTEAGPEPVTVPASLAEEARSPMMRPQAGWQHQVRQQAAADPVPAARPQPPSRLDETRPWTLRWEAAPPGARRPWALRRLTLHPSYAVRHSPCQLSVHD